MLKTIIFFWSEKRKEFPDGVVKDSVCVEVMGVRVGTFFFFFVNARLIFFSFFLLLFFFEK